MERKEFGEPVQTATVVGAAYGIHRTTLTQAAKAGVLGRSAYRSGDAWLIKTDHEDFWEWPREHEYHPRVKGYRKQQAAKAEQQRLLEEAETPEGATEASQQPGSLMVSIDEQREPEPGTGAPMEPSTEGDRPAAPILGGDARMDELHGGDPGRTPAGDAPTAPSPGGDASADGLDGGVKAVEKAVRRAAGDLPYRRQQEWRSGL